MKKKTKSVIARNASELAAVHGLPASDAIQFELHTTLNNKIIDIVKKAGLTHVQVAKLAETSRARVTAILNRNTHRVSTDLLLRILYRLGYSAKISFSKVA